jgi:hypothetical protein
MLRSVVKWAYQAPLLSALAGEQKSNSIKICKFATLYFFNKPGIQHLNRTTFKAAFFSDENTTFIT